MQQTKKRILIAGFNAYAQAYSRALKHEGFEIVHTLDDRETHIEWVTGEFCAAIILEPEHLLPLISRPLALLNAHNLRPLLYLAIENHPGLVRDDLPLFTMPAYETEEMLLEILRALIRRKDGYPKEIRFEGFGVDATKRKISFNGVPLSLSSKQFALLFEFVSSGGEMLDQSYLHHQLWPEKDFDRNRLAAQVSLLRGKFWRKKIPMMILNNKGQGYLMKPHGKPLRRPSPRVTAPITRQFS